VKQTRIPRRILPDVRSRFADLIDAGASKAEIMASLGLKKTTYFVWKKAYERGGRQALQVRPAPGGPRRLTEEQHRRLYALIVGKDPRQLSFDFGLWTRKIVRQVLVSEFGVEMTLQGVGKLLGRLGLSPQRPLYRAYQQNAESVREWKQDTFPKIQRRARQAGADLYFCDEASIRSDHHAGTTWAPVGQTPTVVATGERVSVNMISAVTPKGALCFDAFSGTCNAAAFIDFLKKLSDTTDAPVFVIVDGSPIHRAHAVTDYVASTKGKVALFFLPGYSPQLNPDEWVWKNVKHDQMKRQPIMRGSELHHRAVQALTRLQQLPDTIRGFFNDPELAYIKSS
jgi:transposase